MQKVSFSCLFDSISVDASIKFLYFLWSRNATHTFHNH